MIPKQEFIKIIDKFYSKMDELNEKIEKSDEKDIEKNYRLFRRFHNMMDIWMMMDDYMETIHSQINIALEEDPEVFERYRNPLRKTATITLSDIKDEGWSELGWDLFGSNTLERTDEEHDRVSDKINNIFQYGEYGTIQLVVDDKLRIIAGNIIPFKDDIHPEK